MTNENRLTGDLVLQLLRNEVRRVLREQLEITAKPLIDQVVDEAVASLEFQIRTMKDNMNMTDIFDVKVTRRQ